jgi:hypothetical protein
VTAFLPTAGLVSLAWSMPACCCGGPGPPSPGPPGSISGHIQFPAGTQPAPLAVYALDEDRPFTAYFITRIRPPASDYEIGLPPGDYALVARMDSDPLSAGGYIACHASACTPFLTSVRLNAGQALTRIDIANWGSSYAASAIWGVDMFGSMMSVPATSSASATTATSPTALPVRQRPQGPTPILPAERDLPSIYQGNNMRIRLDLPANWYEVHGPVQPLADASIYYFANEAVKSPLSLDANGVVMLIEDFCRPIDASNLSAQASFFNTQQGMAHFYFLDRDRPAAGQPFEGFEYLGTKDASPGCLFFEFAGATRVARDSNLATFDQIVFQARFV